MLGEEEHVAAPRAERRHFDLDDVDPKVEVFPEGSLCDRRLEITVGRRHQAHVARDLRIAADRPDCPLLQDPQKLGLQGEWQFADLVEQERPAIGLNEEAGAGRAGVGEGAAHVPEQLTFQQRLGYGGTVDGDEGASAAPAAFVERARDELLTGAALAGDEHGGIRVRDPFEEIIHRLHGRARATELCKPPSVPHDSFHPATLGVAPPAPGRERAYPYRAAW